MSRSRRKEGKKFVRASREVTFSREISRCKIEGVPSASWLSLLISIFHPSPATRHFSRTDVRRDGGEKKGEGGEREESREESWFSRVREVGWRAGKFERRSPNFGRRKTENGFFGGKFLLRHFVLITACRVLNATTINFSLKPKTKAEEAVCRSDSRLIKNRKCKKKKQT